MMGNEPVIYEETAKKTPTAQGRSGMPMDTEEQPNPEWVRGRCPDCGGSLVSNLYYIGGRGYVVRWECWEALRPTPTCAYKVIL